MPYKPTGRPPGRPPTRPKPAPKPKPEPVPEVQPEPVAAQPVTRPAPYYICRDCFPDGWPKGATGLACPHGIWSRPWVI